MSFNIWEGIYSDFSQCPKGKEVCWSESWVTRQVERINKLKAEIKSSPDSAAAYQTSLLPVVSAVMAANLKKDKMKILDFGGGLGASYMLMSSGCLKNADFDFYIVEGKDVCQKGKDLFIGDNKIHFLENLPETIQQFDIIHCCSSLQYIEEWRGLMKAWAGYEPAFILLADLPAGDIPTYATVQNYYESKIPYWFFNINDIIDAMSAVGYTPVFKSVCTDERLGKRQPLPQDNFPAEYRLGDSCNLLFYRNKK